MGINRESDVAASLMIGPTSEGMVRIYVESEGVEIPMDFEPDEALEIAGELQAAAETARNAGKGSAKHRDDGGGPKGNPRGKRDAGRR